MLASRPHCSSFSRQPPRSMSRRPTCDAFAARCLSSQRRGGSGNDDVSWGERQPEQGAAQRCTHLQEPESTQHVVARGDHREASGLLPLKRHREACWQNNASPPTRRSLPSKQHTCTLFLTGTGRATLSGTSTDAADLFAMRKAAPPRRRGQQTKRESCVLTRCVLAAGHKI